MPAILLREIFSKFSMVLQASLGRSAAVGSKSPFVQIMKDKRRLAIAGTITIILEVLEVLPEMFWVLLTR